MKNNNIYLRVKILDKKCRIPNCGKKHNLTVHHIVPRSQGGPNELWNLITVCQECHDKITAKKIKDTTYLKKLLRCGDFRWEQAYEWHKNNEQIKKERKK